MVTIDDQIACVKREIRLREKVYPSWVFSGRMKAGQSERELAAMRAVLATLEHVRDEARPGLFQD